MQGSSKTTLKITVFLFTHVKGQNKRGYSSVINWKLKMVKID